MIRLLGIRCSPWTQRARSALDHGGVRHQFEDYVAETNPRLARHVPLAA